MRLWTPNGNKWQTEIDVMIAELRYNNQQLEETIAGIKMTLSLLDREISDLEHAIFFLKNSDTAVSVFEFHRMKKDLLSSKKAKIREQQRIPDLKQKMSDNDREIKRLDEQRIAVRTQVIPIKDRRGE